MVSVELTQPEAATLRIMARERLIQFRNNLRAVEWDAFNGDSEAQRRKTALEERIAFYQQLLRKLNQ